MADFIIRDATQGDISRITAIYADAVDHGTATYELHAPDEAEMARRHAALTAEEYPYLVAETGGEVLGYAYGGPFRARPAYRFIVEDSIYVAPEANGKGIGRALLEALVATCTDKGFRQLIAVIGDGVPDSASVRLHERLGFAHSGTLVGSGFKHGRWLDTAFMQLPLNAGNGAPPDPASVPERRFQTAAT